VDLEAIRDSTASLTQSVEKAVMVGITKYFEVGHIGSGDITEARVKEMIACAVATAIAGNTEELMKQFDNKFESLGSAFGEASGNTGSLDTSDHSPPNVRRMFEASENNIRNACGQNKRMDQLKWTTVVKKLRMQIKSNLTRVRELAEINLTRARELAEMSSDSEVD
jgi:hypothetical protein